MHHHARRRPLLVLGIAATLAASAAVVSTDVSATAATASVSAVSTASSSASASATAPTGASSAASASIDLSGSAAASLVSGFSGTLSVAVQNLGTGASTVYGDTDDAYDTASIVKVDILAALLLQTQDQGGLTSSQQALAERMIERSDNDAATALWNAIGGSSGLTAANKVFGLTGTTAGTGSYWGLTRTTAADQLTLLRVVFASSGSPLSTTSQKYLQSLMSQVVDGQDWGVSAAGNDAVLKNGWLQRSTTGLWVVNSIGRVTVDGQQLLVAVLSNGGGSEAASVAAVERLAEAAATAATAT